ncbi:hypothetical protein FGO68_gene10113 [Halteria grandinella]|uniref:Uncharacterized protein n=1 Tax=Halteria grandinella TaxID=5974 RepID=A0A8J8NUS0_HALGN|nr:hypothetical protein FGO68_gene10113 [Halteria grandinella]
MLLINLQQVIILERNDIKQKKEKHNYYINIKNLSHQMGKKSNSIAPEVVKLPLQPDTSHGPGELIQAHHKRLVHQPSGGLPIAQQQQAPPPSLFDIQKNHIRNARLQSFSNLQVDPLISRNRSYNSVAYQLPSAVPQPGTPGSPRSGHGGGTPTIKMTAGTTLTSGNGLQQYGGVASKSSFLIAKNEQNNINLMSMQASIKQVSDSVMHTRSNEQIHIGGHKKGGGTKLANNHKTSKFKATSGEDLILSTQSQSLSSGAYHAQQQRSSHMSQGTSSMNVDQILSPTTAISAVSVSQTMPPPPKPQKRRDRLGNFINQGVQKRWQVTFRDMIAKGETLITIHEVESYKEYNKIEDDPYKELSWKEQFKRLKEKEESEKTESCNCIIF